MQPQVGGIHLDPGGAVTVRELVLAGADGGVGKHRHRRHRIGEAGGGPAADTVASRYGEAVRGAVGQPRDQHRRRSRPETDGAGCDPADIWGHCVAGDRGAAVGWRTPRQAGRAIPGRRRDAGRGRRRCGHRLVEDLDVHDDPVVGPAAIGPGTGCRPGAHPDLVVIAKNVGAVGRTVHELSVGLISAGRLR